MSNGLPQKDKKPENLLEYIKQYLKELGDSWDNIITIWINPERYSYDKPGVKISKEEAERRFVNEPPGSSYGGTEDTSFHIYTKDNILFMGEYDGSEWITSIPRSPKKERHVSHVGAG